MAMAMAMAKVKVKVVGIYRAECDERRGKALGSDDNDGNAEPRRKSDQHVD